LRGAPGTSICHLALHYPVVALGRWKDTPPHRQEADPLSPTPESGLPIGTVEVHQIAHSALPSIPLLSPARQEILTIVDVLVFERDKTDHVDG
jgi:hypothetical protein